MSAEGRLSLKDGLRVASVGLRARPLRAALSALGIAIGTAAIVASLGLSSCSQAGLLAEIDRLGTNMLTVEDGRGFAGAHSGGALATPEHSSQCCTERVHMRIASSAPIVAMFAGDAG
jgi:putative ABC transport system permease protein